MTSPGDVLVADVVVIGSGVSGLTTALSLEGRDVVVLTKGPLASGSTRWAQGGIAAAIGPDDAPDLHAADTIGVGAGLNDPVAVADFEALVALAGERDPRLYHELLENVRLVSFQSPHLAIEPTEALPRRGQIMLGVDRASVLGAVGLDGGDRGVAAGRDLARGGQPDAVAARVARLVDVLDPVLGRGVLGGADAERDQRRGEGGCQQQAQRGVGVHCVVDTVSASIW